MGLNLSAGGKSKEKGKSSSGKKEKVSSKPKRVEQEVDPEDEVVVPDAGAVLEEANTPEEVKPVAAFEGGLVNPALRNAVNAHWRRSTESDILAQVLQEDLLIRGVFFGAIYMKPSFARRAGGSALL